MSVCCVNVQNCGCLIGMVVVGKGQCYDKGEILKVLYGKVSRYYSIKVGGGAGLDIAAVDPQII